MLKSASKEFYVEVFMPPFPNKGRKVRVFRKFVRDALSPNLVALYKVTAIDSKDALALTLLGRADKVIGGPWHGMAVRPAMN